MSQYDRLRLVAAATVGFACLAAACSADRGAQQANSESDPSSFQPPITQPTGQPTCSAPPPVEVAPCVVLVPDPRPGDLRVDDNADLLPADYSPPAASSVITDLHYGPDPAHRLDLYLPTEGSAPVMLFLHSGGWVGGTRASVPPMVLRFVERGYAVAAVDYRLAPEHAFPSAVEDAKRAVRWLKTADEVAAQVDGDRIVIYGTSAGGHLAAMVGAAPGTFEPTDLSPEMESVDSRVAGIVSVVGPTELQSFYTHPHAWAAGLTEALLGCSPCSEAELANASPTSHLREGLPPAYWAYGEQDCLVDPQTQGAVIASEWAVNSPSGSSWFDLIEGCAHNVDPTTINQRWVERFVDLAASGSDIPAIK